MFEAKIENSKGNILKLTDNENKYQILKITGLNPPKAQINISNIVGIDGSNFNSSKLETREIVITLKLNGYGASVEENRQKLYKYFPTKEWCKFYYKSNYRDVYIEGYTENVEDDLFEQNQTMQISMLCPEPYFKSINEIIDDISKSLAYFTFPFTINYNEPIPFSEIQINKITNIYNDSESETGLIIKIDMYYSFKTISIKNIETGDTFTINYDFKENDRLIINTNRTQKSITLIRNGISYNLFTAIQKGSVFLQLALGDNFFSYSADDDSRDNLVNITFKHRHIYRGI